MKQLFEDKIHYLFRTFRPFTVSIIIDIIYLIAIILISLLILFIIKKIALSIIQKLVKRTDTKLDDAIFESKCLHRLIDIIPGIIVYSLATILVVFRPFIEILSIIYISLILVASVFAFLDAINLIYDNKYLEESKKPIKGVLRVVKIIILFVALIVIISKLMRQSPLYILSGLGALSAVFMLVFKDALLGIVAGVQISSNDLVRIGDWIEVPKYGADGDVIDISLTIVKVRNFDKTITTIPAYALISDSFKNWRGMQTWGGRRIKRAINIDISSILFCDEQLLGKLEKIAYLKDYLHQRKEEVQEHNAKNNIDTTIPVNGRRLTNIGTFRRYIIEYLKKHTGIHQDMIVMVRQLSPEKEGVPLEIYAFTSTVVWQEYENIMSDIFDHLFAVAPYFDLRIFQEPSGHDIQLIKK